MFIRFAFAQRSQPVSLAEGQFTAIEAKRLNELRRQYQTYRDSFSLEVNYRRAHFVRWLVQLGYLSEELERREDDMMSAYILDKWSTL